MFENGGLPYNMIWTCFHTFPAGLTLTVVELDKFCLCMAWRRQRYFHMLTIFLAIVVIHFQWRLMCMTCKTRIRTAKHTWITPRKTCCWKGNGIARALKPILPQMIYVKNNPMLSQALLRVDSGKRSYRCQAFLIHFQCKPRCSNATAHNERPRKR